MGLKKTDLVAIRAVKEFIDQHYKEQIDIHRLSVQSNFHPIKLQHAFKATFGVPVYTYLKELRLHYAAKLLTTTDLSIKEISSEVGYRKPKYFSPVFKTFYNLTPTQYRLQNSA
jgi:AraC-like DNA-binding protein